MLLPREWVSSLRQVVEPRPAAPNDSFFLSAAADRERAYGEGSHFLTTRVFKKKLLCSHSFGENQSLHPSRPKWAGGWGRMRNVGPGWAERLRTLWGLRAPENVTTHSWSGIRNKEMQAWPAREKLKSRNRSMYKCPQINEPFQGEERC